MTYDEHSATSTLTRFSLQRRITVLVLFLSILVVGAVATIGIPLELLPRGFEAQSLQVITPWADSPTQEVLDKVTLPLEEELSTVRGLDGLNSYSRTGRSSVYLRFKRGTDMDVAYREARDRVERAKLLFPEGIEKVFIRKEDLSGIPVCAVGLAIDPNLTDYYNLVQNEIILPFSRIDGVASVTANGLEEKEIIIEVDRDAAEGAGLNIFQLAQQLGQDNFSMASGNVHDSGKKFLLRSLAVYRNLEELENRLIAPSIRLRDVARVRYEEPDKRYSVRVNSRPAVAVMIVKEGEANTVDVSREIIRTIETMRLNPRLSSILIDPLFNQGQVIEDSIGNLLNNGLVGGVLAGLVLYFFLRRFRLTAIISLSIPLSLLIALVVIFFMGETLNILSILGLVICVGLLVDNSVVVAENIVRLHKEGASRRQACIHGASEIALAIIMATMTTVIVFLPVALVEGQGQFFLQRLALPISVSLIASLFVALVFIPLSVYMTVPTKRQKKSPGLFKRLSDGIHDVLRIAYEASFGRLQRIYSHALKFFLGHRLDLVLGLALIFAITQAIAFKEVSFVDVHNESGAAVQLNVSMSNEYNFDDASEYFRQAEKVFEENQEEYGLDGYFIFHGTRFGEIQAWINDDIEQTITAKQLAEKMLDDLPEWAGVDVFYGRESQAEDAEGQQVFAIRLQGEDATMLDQVAEGLETIFLQMQGVLGIRKGEDQAPNELALVVDRDRATASGVNPEFIAGVVGYALRGSVLPRYNADGREIPVRIRFEEEDRESLTELADFAVPTDSGEILPISALTETRMLKTARGIFRRDKRITRTITLELKEEDASDTKARLTALVSRLDLPEGVTFGLETPVSQNEDLANMQFAAVLSIIFIYLLMGFLFESFVLPLSIILTIPLASIGVAWSHFAMGKNLDFLGVVGAVLLIGVVVNNGIVLIDYVNRLRASGYQRSQALILGAERRFRPIAMTALTTIIGMIPLTFSEPSNMGLSYESFGLTLIGGMTTATFLTLLVVPIFYTFFDDTRLRLGQLLKQVVSWRR